MSALYDPEFQDDDGQVIESDDGLTNGDESGLSEVGEVGEIDIETPEADAIEQAREVPIDEAEDYS